MHYASKKKNQFLMSKTLVINYKKHQRFFSNYFALNLFLFVLNAQIFLFTLFMCHSLNLLLFFYLFSFLFFLFEMSNLHFFLQKIFIRFNIIFSTWFDNFFFDFLNFFKFNWIFKIVSAIFEYLAVFYNVFQIYNIFLDFINFSCISKYISNLHMEDFSSIVF